MRQVKIDPSFHFFSWLFNSFSILSENNRICDKFANNSYRISNEFLTLESGVDVGLGITVGPGKLVKKNKHRALNKRRA